MKMTHIVVLAVTLGILASQSFAERRRIIKGGHSAPSKPATNSAEPKRAEENTYGKTPTDKSVTWDYTVTLKPGASLEDIRKVKKALTAAGATFNHGKLDEPFFSVKTHLSEDEIKGLSDQVATVENSVPTKNFTIWFNQETNWAEFKKELTKNKMQITFIAGDVNKPVYFAVKSAVLNVGEIYALVGKYIGSNGDKPGVEEN